MPKDEKIKSLKKNMNSRMMNLLIKRAKGIDREASGRKKKVKK